MSLTEYAITGEAFHLNKIFSSDFEYVIPSYQRPYSWEIEHISQLFNDLYDFYQNEPENSYFLGSIVVIKELNKPLTQVVDGQQRLTSLTIILAALIQFLPENLRRNACEYIQQPENLLEGIEAKPRLTLRSRDHSFFHQYVQELNFEQLLNLDPMQLDTDAKRNIRANTIKIIELMQEVFRNNPDKALQFYTFLLRRCCLVLVSTANYHAAFRIFSVMNNRGLDLLPVDIIKAKLIGKIDNEKQQDNYTQKWDDLEQYVGRHDFNDLFGHIRMIYLRAKYHKNLLEDFEQLVLSTIDSSEHFIDKLLTPCAKAYAIAKQKELYVSSHNAQEINQLFKWLNHITHSDWLPVAMFLLLKHQKNADILYKMLKKLERLSAYLHLTAKDITKRMERYGKVIQELDKNPNEIPNSLQLSVKEQQEWFIVLNGNIYTDLTAVRKNYLVLRLDAVLSDSIVSYQFKKGAFTIEHVLPQTVPQNSEWAKWWKTNEEIEEWVHRLGNLVLLNRIRNSAASNLDFSVKKEKYFLGNQKLSPYALTCQVLQETSWQPKIVEKRQKLLLSKLIEEWELDYLGLNF